jgi:hypothetical protein
MELRGSATRLRQGYVVAGIEGQAATGSGERASFKFVFRHSHHPWLPGRSRLIRRSGCEGGSREGRRPVVKDFFTPTKYTKGTKVQPRHCSPFRVVSSLSWAIIIRVFRTAIDKFIACCAHFPACPPPPPRPRWADFDLRRRR